ncbi:MAG: WD40 repeat domain-containing protein [Gemmataceae bacterium]
MTPNPEKLKAGTKHGLKFIALGVAQRPDGKLYLAGNDFKVYEADAGAKLELKELGGHDSYVTGAALAGTTLITCSYDQHVTWWDTQKRTKIRSVEAHSKWARQVTASPDGRLVASVADDMVCKVFDVASGKVVHELRGHKERTPNHFPSMLYACAFSADGKLLATADKVGKVVVWDVRSGKEVKVIDAPGFYTWDGRQRTHSIGGVRAVAFSPDGKLLAAGGIGHIGNVDHLDGPARVEVFDWQGDRKPVLFEKTKYKGIVNRLAFGPGGWLLAGGGAGTGFLAFLDVAKAKVLKEQDVPFHVHGFTLNDMGDAVVAAGHNGVAAFEMKG